MSTPLLTNPPLLKTQAFYVEKHLALPLPVEDSGSHGGCSGLWIVTEDETKVDMEEVTLLQGGPNKNQL